MNTITIYTEIITPRFTYACNIIFKTILNIEYAFTNNIEECTDKTINYSDKEIANAFQIYPSGFLNQKGLTKV